MSKEKEVIKIFLDNLPKWGIGRYEGKINWTLSIGQVVDFIYKDIKGKINIVDYNKNTQYLKIKYNEKEFDIKTGNLSRCRLGEILGKFSKDFKVEIGHIFKDKKRDLIVTDKEYRIKNKKSGYTQNEKWYKYTCNKCGWTEGWMIEGNLKQGNGCACCCASPQIVVEHINSIVAKEETQWMIPYFQGGYDEAKLYNKSSNKKIYPICPDCGEVKGKMISMNTIYEDKTIHCICGDGISYCEKLVNSILSQLGLDFKTQLSSTSFKWCNKYLYDFYFKFNNEDYIIETHGIQHYSRSFEKIKTNKKIKTVKEEQENDNLKMKLALENGIKEENYIIIDCRKSNLEFIKQNTLNSRLGYLFNLNTIDWIKCEKSTLSNLVKQACEYKNNNPNMTTGEIGKIMNINFSVIASYLKRGNGIWCHYDAKEEIRRIASINGKSCGKQVEIFKDGISLGIYPSCSELERKSKDVFEIKLYNSQISSACNGKRPNYKGFTFKYVTEEPQSA